MDVAGLMLDILTDVTGFKTRGDFGGGSGDGGAIDAVVLCDTSKKILIIHFQLCAMSVLSVLPLFISTCSIGWLFIESTL